MPSPTPVTSKRLLRCKRCGKFFLSENTLRRHKQVHLEERGDRIRKRKGKNKIKILSGIVLEVQQVDRKQREIQNDIFNEQKRKTAEMAKRHPLGDVIGSTQVTQFKSPRSDIRWATKRKQKS